MKSVILLGIKHCGKSSQSVLLGKKLDFDTYDTDQVIVDMTGKSAREIYTEFGEESFKTRSEMLSRLAVASSRIINLGFLSKTLASAIL